MNTTNLSIYPPTILRVTVTVTVPSSLVWVVRKLANGGSVLRTNAIPLLVHSRHTLCEYVCMGRGGRGRGGRGRGGRGGMKRWEVEKR